MLDSKPRISFNEILEWRRTQGNCTYLILFGFNAVDLLFKVAVNMESVIDTSFVWIYPIPTWNTKR